MGRIRHYLANYKRDFIFLIALLFYILAAIPYFTYLHFASDLGSEDRIMNRNDTGVILMDRNNVPFFTFYQAKYRDIIPLSKIPLETQEAVIASEDRNFYSHPGFSAEAILRSLISDVTYGDAAYGGSTITQQLVKNSLLTPNKNFLRKYQELALALEIERRYSKKKILEMYLNSVYFGQGAFGIEEAAQRYFNKPAASLTLSESALLTGILPSPSKFSPLTGDYSAARVRQKLVLQEMVNQRYITQAQAAQAYAAPFQFNQENDTINVYAPHFALYVLNLLIQKYGEEEISRAGLRVKTSLDLQKQIQAEKIVENQVENLTANHATNGAAISLNPKTGEILAYVGSRDWNNPQFGKIDMIQTPRQPGSSFKPIVYARAFEERIITPATVLKDVPTKFPGNYTPLDYDRKFRGNVLVRRALSNSLNIPAVEVIEKVGVSDALETAKRFGITTLADPSSYGPSLVLGAAEVKPIELATVYATFANSGMQNKATAILEIHNKAGQTLYKYDPKPQNIISPQVSFLISSILSDDRTRAEEFGNLLTISRTAAVKTGTTEDFRDAWTFGYTPSIVAGAWVGNDDNSPMDNVAGSLGAAPIWRKLMELFLKNTPKESFHVPDGIATAYICSYDGGLLKTASSSGYLEYFLKGTQPVTACGGISSVSSPKIPTPSFVPSQSASLSPSSTPSPHITVSPSPVPSASNTVALPLPARKKLKL